MSALTSVARQAYADKDAEIMRYEALFALTSRLLAAESVADCAQAAATGLKYIASVVAWRIIMRAESGFTVIQGARGQYSIKYHARLSPWNVHRWAQSHPESLQRDVDSCVDDVFQEAGEPLNVSQIFHVHTFPFARSGLPSSVMIAGARAPGFTALDVRFLRLAATAMCDQLSALTFRQQALQALQHQARNDELTGLWNRRSIRGFLEEQLPLFAEQTVAVLMCDVDKFKVINDTYGHAAGDEVLRTVSRLLRASIRETDQVGRYGGEEFLVILPGGTRASADIVAERIRQAVAAQPVRAVGHDIPVTISIGGATTITGFRFDPELLIQRADNALYQAKRAGRDRVAINKKYSVVPSPTGTPESAAQESAERTRRIEPQEMSLH